MYPFFRVSKWTYGVHAAPKKLSCQWLRFNCDSASAWAGPLWTAYVSVNVYASVAVPTFVFGELLHIHR